MILDSAIPIGPFELLEPVGTGGMAVVFRARHVAQDVETAVKVLTSRRARTPRFVDAFHNEVRAAARLRHPGIVTVLDLGVVDERAERALGGRVIAGSPFFAMEFVRGGTLSSLSGRLRWPRMKFTLLGILDALSHAHARGVVHRDLKPSNILLDPVEQGRWPRPRIADFGVAATTDDTVSAASRPDAGTNRVTGTPRYMAPEQIQGRWRDQGPWTDLYAVGCIAFQLARGFPPYVFDSVFETLDAHVSHPIPMLQPNMVLPDEFEPWVRRLLQKSVWDRYRHAADAAHALAGMSTEEDDGFDDRATHTVFVGTDGEVAIEEEETIIRLDTADLEIAGTQQIEAREWVARDTALTRRGTAESGDRGCVPMRPPVPRDWRRRSLPAQPPRLLGAGINLFNLRPIPMLDREPERTAIWDALHGAISQRTPGCVVLHGRGGAGKSRIAEWMAQRAAEVGAAVWLKATHSPMNGPRDGLAAMFERHLELDGLSRSGALERLRNWFAAHGRTGPDELYDATALVEMISLEEPGEEGGTRVSFNNPEERFVVLRRILEKLARERPVLLWLDDVQWSLESLFFVRYLVDEGGPLPLLIVATVQDDASTTTDEAEDALDALVEHDTVETVAVEPLDAVHQRELVQSLLGLDDELAGSVVERTGGMPLFAVQVLGDWVERGVLVVGEDGFELRPGERPEIPDELHQVWIGRVEQALQGDGPGWRGLELAAALGIEVEADEWRTVCERAGVTVSGTGVAPLFSASLLVPHADGWAFTHNMLRESLVRRSKGAGHWAEDNRICADVVEARTGLERIRDRERHAYHLVEAAEHDRAVDALLGAAEQCVEFGEHHRAMTLLDQADDTLDTLGVPAEHPRRVPIWVQRGWAANQTAEAALAAEMAQRAERVARTTDDARLVGDAMRLVGTVTRSESISDALDAYREATRHYSAAGYEHGLGRTLMSLGWALGRIGQYDDALAELEAGIEVFSDIGSELWESRIRQVRSFVYAQQGEYQRARADLDRAMEIDERIGNTYGLACGHVEMGELLRFQHRPEDARPHYEQALASFQTLGAQMVMVTRLNLGLVALELQDFSTAALQFRWLRGHPETMQGTGLWGQVLIGLACCEAAAKNWAVYRDLLEAAGPWVDPDAIVDRDLAITATWAGEIADADGRADDAALAWNLAIPQLDALGKTERADRLRARLGTRGDS